MRADRDVPGGRELATDAAMRQPEFEALDTLKALIRKIPKEEIASGRSLCGRSGRRFFRCMERERERDQESMGIIELEAKTTPFLTVSSGPRRTEFFVGLTRLDSFQRCWRRDDMSIEFLLD